MLYLDFKKSFEEFILYGKELYLNILLLYYNLLFTDKKYDTSKVNISIIILFSNIKIIKIR